MKWSKTNSSSWVSRLSSLKRCVLQVVCWSLFMRRGTNQAADGATYFVTAKSWEITFWFEVLKASQIIVGKLLDYRDRGDYLLHDFVLMPRHLHLILTPSSVGLEKCVQVIKGGSSLEIHKLRGSRTEVWEQGYFAVLIGNCQAYQTKRNFMISSPVIESLVKEPEMWEWGSASGKYKLDPVPRLLVEKAQQ